MLTQWIIRRIPDYENVKDERVRSAYGKAASLVGIGCNVLLFAGKLFAGLLSGSVAIMADAVNNLSDVSSSLISLLGFKLADRPADAEHPYGHGRFEYLSGMTVAVMILVIGVELLKSSVGKIFAPVRPALSSYQNNRDHRKICVIDGHTAFTGGVNLADEYINQRVRFGHWKDTAVMLKGKAVDSFTMMFLQLWDVTERDAEEYRRFLCPETFHMPEGMDYGGFVMPYADSPLDGENVGESVYLDILGRSRRYVHITTPYLILDDTTLAALKFAAKRGVEVIVIMPHIPDKLYAYLLARSYYAELLRAGVQIYEYTPGFIHAKMFTSDDEKAVVGTINLDFRSLYLHFECASYFFRNAVVMDVEEDFQKTLAKSERITLENCRKYPFIRRFAGKALRILAPLM